MNCECVLCQDKARYKYDDNCYCGECLIDVLTDEDEITSSPTINYYVNGEYIGDSDSIEEVMDGIVSNLSVEEID